jgi:SAM-dependent methyltransferase
MDASIVKRILELNKDFYQFHAQAFSESRRYPFKGWGRALSSIIGNTNKLSKNAADILDVASGNCRLFEYLQKNSKLNFKYTGIDNCGPLMEIAKEKYSKFKNFNQLGLDMINDLDQVNTTFDLVCAFGITHHIPSEELRLKWFTTLSKLISSKGALIITFWYTKKVLPEKVAPFKDADLESGDKMLSWNNDAHHFRYVHIYPEKEIQLVISILAENGLKLVDRFDEDENQNSHNLYLIFKKD